MHDAAPTLEPLLTLMAEREASDLFLTVGAAPHVAVDGVSVPAAPYKLAPGQVRQMAYALMSEAQIEEFERELEMNFALNLEGIGRFRFNLYFQRGDVSLVARYVKAQIPSLASLNLPEVLGKLALLDRGLILVVGSAGSGKSTTLASMLDHRNSRISGHIVCIEDPIEFLHPHKRSIVDQREVGLDTHSFGNALRNVLREAADVIMLGEIRDTQTMEYALHYAQTGHLCVGTLHATSTVQAIDRVAHFFPDAARNQMLNDLSLNIVGIVAQRLVPGINSKRVLAAEVLLATPHIRDLIRRDQLHEMKEAMGRAIEIGVQTFDDHLYEHYQEGRISLENALKSADSRTDLSLKINLEKGFRVDDSGVSLFD